MKKDIFITVRTGSTRLPQKALIKIQGIPAIEHLIKRVKNSREADDIILCTTELPADDILVKIAQNNQIKFFRGSEKDKLKRWQGAAQKFNTDFIITADGDDLFCEPELMDLGFQQAEKEKPDFIEAKGLICGSFTYGISATALNKVCTIKNTTDTEMMWVYFTDTGLFNCQPLKNVPGIYQRPEIRMTLDYPDDLKFFEKIIDYFAPQGRYYNLKEIINYLDQHPEIIKINQYLMKPFLENQKKKTHLKLKT